MKIHELLKQTRQNFGETQQQFGDRFGLSSTAISLMESGKRGVNDRVVNFLLEQIGGLPKSRKDIIFEIVEKHTTTINSFIDKNGHNHFVDCVDELNERL